MDRQFGFVDIQSVCHFVPKRSLLEHYTFPRPGPAPSTPHPSQEVERDSLGLDCSVPGMIEDHGSDVSVEDDYEYPGTELWDTFWQTRMRNRTLRGPRYPALIDSPATTCKSTQNRDSIMEHNRQVANRQVASRDQTNRYSGASPSPSPSPSRRRERPRTPKPAPRASYSIFPPSSTTKPPSGIPSFSRPRPPNALPLREAPPSCLNTPRPSLCDRDESLDLARSRTASPELPATARPRRTAPTATIRAVTPTPGSPVIPFPSLPTEPPRPPSRLKPLPSPPSEPQTATKRPSFANLRKLSFSKLATNSSPSLAQLARSHALSQPRSQSQLKSRLSNDVTRSQQHPLRESSLPPAEPTRPLPPLPPSSRQQAGQPSPEPPTVSVFEFDDSDAESIADGSNRQPRRLAQRLIRSLASHNFRWDKDKDKDKGGTRQRSASDGGEQRTPSSAPTMVVAAEATSAQGRRTRADTVGGWASKRKGSVGSGEKEDAVEEDEDGRDGGKPWLTRQSSEVFGRILGRWSA
ncbi:hypothetical protein QBC47DRAFT_399521 [Echria macrotheca]|uniref:Uncharacterized protein n=1 Tax=Echria macrotheca TaxID=438768 RepID=A0AAJ0FEY4_9PEZI|nr:hypothetical protein QBC47DRAFT_399521 [Echria macrotheca]